jgi:hypothetical protein
MNPLKHLFRRTPARNDEFGALDQETAGRIVQDYARFLETSAPLPGRIADVIKLPHSKLMIKDALRICINSTGDPELIGHLKSGYLMLCAWQPDVGERTVGVDFTSLNLEADPMEVAERIQSQSAAMELWNPVIQAEQSELASELRALGV